MVLGSVALAHLSRFRIMIVKVDHNNGAEVFVGCSVASVSPQELFYELLLEFCLNNAQIEIVFIAPQLFVNLDVKLFVDVNYVGRQGPLGSLLRR